MRPMRLFGSFFLTALPLLAMATPAAANPQILFDLKTGQVIEHKDAFKRWYPASLTKLMTAYATFRAVQAGELQLDSPIKVSKKAAGQPPSKMGYKAGSVMTLDNALKMMLVKSANDIAFAIGENVGGSQAAFAERMNAEARRLGMVGTHYVNPNGLFSTEQYTTARDLAILVMALRNEFPQYAHYFSIEGLAVGKKAIQNYNLLIGRYPDADGMKTGFVCESGFNMIGTATRKDRTLVAVVLGEQTAVTRAEAAAALLNQGFGTSTGFTTTIDTLPAGGVDIFVPGNMRQEICTKKPAEEQSEAADAAEAAKSPYLEKLDHAPALVKVGLGGATGPVPAAMVNAVEYADVPIPEWRPDLPPPPGFGAQGDRAATALN